MSFYNICTDCATTQAEGVPYHVIRGTTPFDPDTKLCPDCWRKRGYDCT